MCVRLRKRGGGFLCVGKVRVEELVSPEGFLKLPVEVPEGELCLVNEVACGMNVTGNGRT